MHPSPVGDLSFDTATQLRARPDPSIFDVEISRRWTVGENPNGGLLLALLGRAAALVVAPHDGASLEALAATVTYVAAPVLAAAEIHTTVIRRGRSTSHVRATLLQSERLMVDAVFVMGGLNPGPPRYSDIAPLEIPGPDQCIRLPARFPGWLDMGIMETTDLRLDPATDPFAPPGAGMPVPELRGWTRFADGREPDPLSLLYFVDANPPATLLIGSTGWVPTLSLSVYVRARPAPGWLGLRVAAHHVAGGTVDETCTLWDSEGHVVAQAWQLAGLRFADHGA